jgi:arylsulfatase A-like enzyme
VTIRRSAAVLLVLVAIAAPACLRRRPPHVILIVVDTLRADRLGAYGNQRGLTPFLDELAGRGTVFLNTYATCSWTNPSVASLFTSRYPMQHRVTTFDARLPDAERTLAEILAPHRYINLGFTANLRLTEALGFAQGFRSWGVYPVTKLRADRLRRRALGWSDLVRGTRSTKPVFLYLQYMEPHAPYDPPPAFRARFERRAAPDLSSAEANRKLLDLKWETLTPAEIDHLESLYDGEVAYFDSELRRLFAGLGERGLLDDALVVVTADHGEEFNEHHLMMHGDSLYNQALRVPLVLVGPRVPAGRVVTQNVSLVDVAPTILALAGLPAEPLFEGRSLVPLLTGDAPPVDVVAQLPNATPDFDPRRHTSAIVRGSVKLLALAEAWAARLGAAELYDLASDPLETHPSGYVGGPRSFPPGSPQLAGAEVLLAALRQAEAGLGVARDARPERVPLDPEMREKLRALGYVN